MKKPSYRPLVDYRPCRPTDADGVTRFLGEAFSRRDPPAYAVGATANKLEEFVTLLCPRAPIEGLAIVATFADTGELIGAMLNEDCATPMPDGMERLTRKFDPILDILGQLNDEYWGSRIPSPGEAMHLFLLSVDKRVVGNGVAQELVEESLRLGASRGYGLAVTEATNKVSQHIFRKLGFAEGVRHNYEVHRF